MAQTQTYGLPQDEKIKSPALAGQPPSITGDQGALVPQQNSAPSLPGGNASGTSEPLSQPGPNESQGGGVDLVKDRGTPDEMLNNLDPDAAIRTAEQSAKAVSSESGETGKHSDSAGQKKQANDLLAAQGADPKKSIAELKKQNLARIKKLRDSGEITAEHYTGLKDRWKNIFQIIPKEDMGLFLMDFGMRAMMAGETMGSVGALGAAGSGALQASQARRAGKADQAIQDEATAQTGALEEFGAETSRMNAESSRTRAETDATRASLSGQGYRGEKAWLLELGRSMGKEDEEIWDMFNKVKSPEGRRQDFLDFILKAQSDSTFTQTDPIIGKKYRDFTQDDISTWVNRMSESETSGLDASKKGADALSRALDRNQ